MENTHWANTRDSLLLLWGQLGRTSQAAFSQQACPNSELSEEAVPKVSSELLIV